MTCSFEAAGEQTTLQNVITVVSEAQKNVYNTPGFII